MEDDLECYQKPEMNMEKTIEEKRAAVLAECERLCPNEGDQFKSETIEVTCRMSNSNWKESVRFWIVTLFAIRYHIGPSETDQMVIESMYRLLGLETRDAVAEHSRKKSEFEARINLMDAKQGKYMDLYRSEKFNSAKWESRAWKILEIVRKREAGQRPKTANVLKALRECGKKLESERAKTSKLVEAMEFSRSELSEMEEKTEVGNGGQFRIQRVCDKITEALEAHKKGGAND